MKARYNTSRRHRRPVGVGQPQDGPVTKPYVYKGAQPSGEATYVVGGTVHRWDGRCHAECIDAR
jgi:hypothetical protein